MKQKYRRFLFYPLQIFNLNLIETDTIYFCEYLENAYRKIVGV